MWNDGLCSREKIGTVDSTSIKGVGSRIACSATLERFNAGRDGRRVFCGEVTSILLSRKRTLCGE